MAAPIVQYVVVRGDLLHVLKWPTGALIAQACHASSAIVHVFRDDPNVKAYTDDLDNMHKVVLEVTYSALYIAHFWITTHGNFILLYVYCTLGLMKMDCRALSNLAKWCFSLLLRTFPNWSGACMLPWSREHLTIIGITLLVIYDSLPKTWLTASGFPIN